MTRGETVWKLCSRKGKRLIGTLATDPEVSDTGEQARFLAEQASMWRGTWNVILDGVRYTLGPKSFWRGTHRIERSGQEVAVSGTAHLVDAGEPRGGRRRADRSSALPALDGLHPQPACLERGDDGRGDWRRRGCGRLMTAPVRRPAVRRS